MLARVPSRSTRWLVLCCAVLVVGCVVALLAPRPALALDQSTADATLAEWMAALEADDADTLDELRKPNDDFDDNGGGEDDRPEYPRYEASDFNEIEKAAYDHDGGRWAVRAYTYTMSMTAAIGQAPVSWEQQTAIVLEKIGAKWFVNPYVALGLEDAPDAVERALEDAAD